jgi:hypothetical protein
MSASFYSERQLPLAALARSLPPGRNERPVHVSTLVRWIVDGVRLPDGRRLRLEARRLGHRWVSSLEALDRFVAAQTAAAAPASAKSAGDAALRADAELVARGL